LNYQGVFYEALIHLISAESNTKLLIMKFLFVHICVSLLCFSSLVQAQERPNKPEIIESFLQDLHDPEVADDVILSQHVLLSEGISEEFLSYLLSSITELRLNIQGRNLDQFQLINFPKLPRKDIRDINLEGHHPNDIYFLKYKDRLVVALLVEEDKIASFTLVSNGQYAHFVLY